MHAAELRLSAACRPTQRTVVGRLRDIPVAPPLRGLVGALILNRRAMEDVSGRGGWVSARRLDLWRMAGDLLGQFEVVPSSLT